MSIRQVQTFLYKNVLELANRFFHTFLTPFFRTLIERSDIEIEERNMTGVLNLAEIGVVTCGSFAVAFLAAKACLDGLLRAMLDRR